MSNPWLVFRCVAHHGAVMRRLRLLGQHVPRPSARRVVFLGALLAGAVWVPLSVLLARFGPWSAVWSLAAGCALSGGTVAVRAERPLRAASLASMWVAAGATATAWAVAEQFGTRSLGVALVLWVSAISGGLAGVWLRARGRIR